MATYTPNYNLGKPEPTDQFGYNSFLPLFNDNMDKIDQIGGGGGDVADVTVNGTSVVDPDTKIASITSYFTVVNGELCQVYDDGN